MYINSFIPGITSTAAQAATKPASQASNTNNSNSTNSTDGSSTNSENLFLSILVAELKTQDPTAPMDPTEMVGQMLSMNQLNELIAIHQLLQGPSTS